MLHDHKVHHPGKYMEELSSCAHSAMGSTYSCVHCATGGRLCLNRSMRILNFAFDCEQEARGRGAFMLARVARSLFEMSRRSREWGPEHVALVEAHFQTLRDLAAPLPDDLEPFARPHGAAFEASLAPVEAWVDWLERMTASLIAEQGSDFACLRRGTPAAHCAVAGPCGR